jgi:hypothetical protein
MPSSQPCPGTELQRQAVLGYTEKRYYNRPYPTGDRKYAKQIVYMSHFISTFDRDTAPVSCGKHKFAEQPAMI